MDIKARICIPTYNNSTTIKAVVNDCLSKTDLPILIIDDGSDYDVNATLENIKSNRIDIIRHPNNLGKGKAIQTAIDESVSKGFTHLITIDADGQHLASEIIKILKEAKECPWSLIIGKRNFSDENRNIPGISKFGRKFSNYWVKYETDYIISDSQSGLRCYPLFHVQNINFYTKRFDFEIEVLIRLLWNGVNFREIPVETIYQDKNLRVSHFNKFWDNTRISLLNTILVLFTVFKKGLSAKEISWAVFIGIFIGCTPLWGFHAAIALIVSIIFRLNFIVILIGTQISVPPMIPFLVLASIFCGKYVANKEIYVYILGSLIVGLLLGLIIGLLTYVVLKKFPKTKSWTGKSRGGKFGNWFLVQVIKFLGLKVAYFCLFFIVPYFYFFAPMARRASIEYWKNIKPEYGPLKLRLMVLAHFYRFGTLLMDQTYQQIHSGLKFSYSEDGLSHIVNRIENKKPLILVGAHIGAWSMALVHLSDINLLNNLKIVQFEPDRTKRKEHQIPVNQINNPIFDIKEQLSEGRVVGMLADRPISNSYVLIPFFKKLFPFDTSAFRVAAATNSELAFFFAVKNKSGKYDFICTTPKYYKYKTNMDKNDQIILWTKEFSETLETLLKKYPDQWLNFYPAWSSEPFFLQAQK